LCSEHFSQELSLHYSKEEELLAHFTAMDLFQLLP